MQKHFLVMAKHDFELGRKRRVRNPPPGFQPFDNLANEPRPSVAAAPDHQTVGAGFLQCPVGVVAGRNVAVGDDRDRHRFFDLANKTPVGGASIKLATSTAVHADHADAAGFADPSEPRRVAGALVPSRAHLQGDRQVDRLYRCFEDSRGMSLVAHQRGAGMPVDHLFHRATEIYVDDPRAAISV